MASSGGKSLAVGHISGFQIDPSKKQIGRKNDRNRNTALHERECDHEMLVLSAKITGVFDAQGDYRR